MSRYQDLRLTTTIHHDHVFANYRPSTRQEDRSLLREPVSPPTLPLLVLLTLLDSP